MIIPLQLKNNYLQTSRPDVLNCRTVPVTKVSDCARLGGIYVIGKAKCTQTLIVS